LDLLGLLTQILQTKKRKKVNNTKIMLLGILYIK
jgi:hypothetical protein